MQLLVVSIERYFQQSINQQGGIADHEVCDNSFSVSVEVGSGNKIRFQNTKTFFYLISLLIDCQDFFCRIYLSCLFHHSTEYLSLLANSFFMCGKLLSFMNLFTVLRFVFLSDESAVEDEYESNEFTHAILHPSIWSRIIQLIMEQKISMFSIRRGRHCLVTTLSSISAMSSQLLSGEKHI